MTTPRSTTGFGKRGQTQRGAPPRKQRSVSFFEFYWPYCIGVGGTGVLYLSLLIMALGGNLSVNPIIATVFLFVGAPLLILAYLITATLVTKTLAGIRSSAQTLHGVRNFALASAGGRLGAGAGFVAFCFRKESEVAALMAGPNETLASDLAFLTLTLLTHVGIGMLLGDLVEKKLFDNASSKKEADQNADAALSAPPPLPEPILLLLEKWPFYAALAGACFAFATSLAARVLSEASSLTPGGVAIDAAFCVLAFFVLQFYLTITRKILSGTKWLYDKAADFS